MSNKQIEWSTCCKQFSMTIFLLSFQLSRKCLQLLQNLEIKLQANKNNSHLNRILFSNDFFLFDLNDSTILFAFVRFVISSSNALATKFSLAIIKFVIFSSFRFCFRSTLKFASHAFANVATSTFLFRWFQSLIFCWRVAFLYRWLMKKKLWLKKRIDVEDIERFVIQIDSVFRRNLLIYRRSIRSNLQSLKQCMSAKVFRVSQCLVSFNRIFIFSINFYFFHIYQHIFRTFYYQDA